MDKHNITMDVKNTLKINKVNHPNCGECIQINMSWMSLLDMVSPDDENFCQNFRAHGIEDFDCPVMATPQDVADYLELDQYDYDAWEKAPDEFKEIEKKKSRRANIILNQLGSLLYQDVEYTDDATGKKGLLDQFGNIVVPALFDSCRGVTEMFDIENYAVVEKDGKFYRTPRDGSGKLIDKEGYDKIYLNGETIRDNKHGMVSLKSPQVLIPCEMDWIAYDRYGVSGIIFGKDGKLGMRDTYLHKYISPEYSAYDITTLRFCRDGVWGWISRTADEFFTEPVGERYDVMILATSADSFLSYEDKPKSDPKEEKYIGMEDVEKMLLSHVSEFKKRLKYKLSSLIELPALKFQKGSIASASIVDAIRSLSSENKRIVITTGNNNAPDIHITVSKQDGGKVYRLEWSPGNNALAWYDARLKEIEAFHQLTLPGKDTFSMQFYRDFNAREVHTMAKFIAYYYSSIWNISEEEMMIN